MAFIPDPNNPAPNGLAILKVIRVPLAVLEAEKGLIADKVGGWKVVGV
jgi:hypothetical protein